MDKVLPIWPDRIPLGPVHVYIGLAVGVLAKLGDKVTVEFEQYNWSGPKETDAPVGHCPQTLNWNI